MYFDVSMDASAHFKVQPRNKVSVYVYCDNSGDQHNIYLFTAGSRNSSANSVLKLRNAEPPDPRFIDHKRAKIAFPVGRVILGTFPEQAVSCDEKFRDGLHGLLP